MFYDTSNSNFFTCRLEDANIDLSEWYQESYEGCDKETMLDACRQWNCSPDEIGEAIYRQCGDSDYVACNCSLCDDYEVMSDGECYYWITDDCSGVDIGKDEKSTFKFLVSSKLFDMIFDDDITRDELEDYALKFDRDKMILFCVERDFVCV